MKMGLTCIKVYVSFIVLSVLCVFVLGETGCPPSEDVSPCICRQRPTTRLICANFTSTEDLMEIFQKAERYTFQEVHIQTSYLNYLPHKILESTAVNELYIENSTLSHLFDAAPSGSLLYKLHIENTKIFSIKETSTLKLLKNLRTLVISGSVISKIDSKFTSGIPTGLKELLLVGTSTKSIAEGAFNSLVNLNKIVISNSPHLINITRDVFPQPFNVRFIYLDNNNLDKIPPNLFVNMPNLQFLSLRNNKLTEIPEIAFQGRTQNVPYIRLDGNPLKCDCLLVWLIKDKPEIIGGTCSAPVRLGGKNLQDLRPGDFNC